jgi:hypothetical protein
VSGYTCRQKKRRPNDSPRPPWPRYQPPHITLAHNFPTLPSCNDKQTDVPLLRLHKIRPLIRNLLGGCPRATGARTEPAVSGGDPRVSQQESHPEGAREPRERWRLGRVPDFGVWDGERTSTDQ